MARGASGRPGPPVQQRGGAGRHGAAAVREPAGRLLPGHMQPGRGDQPQAAAGRRRI